MVFSTLSSFCTSSENLNRLAARRKLERWSAKNQRGGSEECENQPTFGLQDPIGIYMLL